MTYNLLPKKIKYILSKVQPSKIIKLSYLVIVKYKNHRHLYNAGCF